MLLLEKELNTIAQRRTTNVIFIHDAGKWEIFTVFKLLSPNETETSLSIVQHICKIGNCITAIFRRPSGIKLVFLQ